MPSGAAPATAAQLLRVKPPQTRQQQCSATDAGSAATAPKSHPSLLMTLLVLYCIPAVLIFAAAAWVLVACISVPAMLLGGPLHAFHWVLSALTGLPMRSKHQPNSSQDKGALQMRSLSRSSAGLVNGFHAAPSRGSMQQGEQLPRPDAAHPRSHVLHSVSTGSLQATSLTLPQLQFHRPHPAWYVTPAHAQHLVQRMHQIDREGVCRGGGPTPTPDPPAGLTGMQTGLRTWKHMMDRHAHHTFMYTAARSPLPSGGTEYYSVTTVADTSPLELMEFLMDDDARRGWEAFLQEATVIEVGPGWAGHREDVVRWRRRFPFHFLTDREYLVARKVWADLGPASQQQSTAAPDSLVRARSPSGGPLWLGPLQRGAPDADLYAVTLSMDEHPAAPPDPSGLVRTTAFLSQWRCRAVPDPWGRSDRSAAEVVLLHTEDIRIPEYLARTAISMGMTKFVKDLVGGVQRFVAERRGRGLDPHAPDPMAYGYDVAEAAGYAAPPPLGAAHMRGSGRMGSGASLQHVLSGRVGAPLATLRPTASEGELQLAGVHRRPAVVPALQSTPLALSEGEADDDWDAWWQAGSDSDGESDASVSMPGGAAMRTTRRPAPAPMLAPAGPVTPVAESATERQGRGSSTPGLQTPGAASSTGSSVAASSLMSNTPSPRGPSGPGPGASTYVSRQGQDTGGPAVNRQASSDSRGVVATDDSDVLEHVLLTHAQRKHAQLHHTEPRGRTKRQLHLPAEGQASVPGSAASSVASSVQSQGAAAGKPKKMWGVVGRAILTGLVAGAATLKAGS